MIKILAVSAVLFFVLCGACSMGATDIGKLCLFSQMSGVITINNEPVRNARLVRTVDYSGKQTDETTTNEQGEFEFPVVFARSIAKYLPQEFAASQEIIVYYNDKEYTMWSGVKRKPDENSESRGKPLVVKCDLNNEEKLIKVNNSPIFSLCTWDVEPDKKRKAF